MKSSVTLFLILSLYTSLAQTSISYRVLEDEPEQANTNFIAPEFGMEYNSTDIGIFLGANGRKDLSIFTAEGIARFDIYSMNSSGTFHLEGGLFLPLSSKEKQKEVPIFLSYNPYAGRTYENNKTYNIEETKFITIPSGKYKNEFGLRGGLHYRVVGIEGEIEGVGTGKVNLGGIYLGGQMTSQAFVRTIINDDVERIGAGFTRVYADVMILPLSELSADPLSAVAKPDGMIGWRLGYQWYVSPHEGEYKFFGNSVFGAEIGQRPLSGFMFNLYWALAFNRS